MTLSLAIGGLAAVVFLALGITYGLDELSDRISPLRRSWATWLASGGILKETRR